MPARNQGARFAICGVCCTVGCTFQPARLAAYQETLEVFMSTEYLAFARP